MYTSVKTSVLAIPYLVARMTIYCTMLRAMISVQANYSGSYRDTADSGLDSLTFAKVFSANYLFFKFAKVFHHQSFPLYGTLAAISHAMMVCTH